MRTTDMEQYSKAITSAFLADMAAAPTLVRSVEARRVNGRGLADIILGDLDRGVSGAKPVLFPNLRAVMRTQINVETAKASGGMGEWAELAAAVVSAAGSYVTATQTAKMAAKTESIAKQQAAAAAEADRQRAALAAAQGVPSAAVPSGGGEGLPSWLLPAAGVVAVGGAIVYAATR